MIACDAALVRVIAQKICGTVRALFHVEQVQSPPSDGCSSSRAQSIVRPSSRGGVPVLSRAIGRFGGAQLLGEPMRAILTDAPADHPLLAAEHPPAQKGTRREHDRGRGQRRAVTENKPLDHRAVIGQSQCRRFTGDHRDAILGGEQLSGSHRDSASGRPGSAAPAPPRPSTH